MYSAPGVLEWLSRAEQAHCACMYIALCSLLLHEPAKQASGRGRSRSSFMATMKSSQEDEVTIANYLPRYSCGKEGPLSVGNLTVWQMT